MCVSLYAQGAGWVWTDSAFMRRRRKCNGMWRLGTAGVAASYIDLICSVVFLCFTLLKCHVKPYLIKHVVFLGTWTVTKAWLKQVRPFTSIVFHRGLTWWNSGKTRYVQYVGNSMCSAEQWKRNTRSAWLPVLFAPTVSTGGTEPIHHCIQWTREPLRCIATAFGPTAIT